MSNDIGIYKERLEHLQDNLYTLIAGLPLLQPPPLKEEGFSFFTCKENRNISRNVTCTSSKFEKKLFVLPINVTVSPVCGALDVVSYFDPQQRVQWCHFELDQHKDACIYGRRVGPKRF